MELGGALSRYCSLCHAVPDGAGLQITDVDVALGWAGEYVYINFALQLIMQHVHKTASKVGHRMDRDSGEALQKKGMEMRGKS